MLEAALDQLRGRFSGTAARPVVTRLPATELVDLLCPAGLSPASARLDWARRVLTHYHGEAAADWPLLDWQGFGARGVTAWRGGPDGPTRAQMAGRIDACWPCLLQALLKSRPALARAQAGRVLLLESATDDSAVLTLCLTSLGALQSLQRHRLDAPWPQSLQSLLHDEQLQHPPAHTPLTAAWLQGPGAAEQVQALVSTGLDAQARPEAVAAARPPWPQDFVQLRARPGPLAWLALAGGLLCLLASAWGLQQAWQQRSAVQQLAAPATIAPRQLPVDALPSAVLQRLNHPWRDVFLAAEKPAVAGLNWLVLDHQAGGDLRLQGVAQTAEAVQRAATALRAQPPWTRALIARMEAEGDGQVFELTAQGPGFKP